MKPYISGSIRAFLLATLGYLSYGIVTGHAQTNERIHIVEIRGKVEILPRGSDHWVLTATNQPLYSLDRIRTGTNSSVGILWEGESVLRFNALSELEILPPTATEPDNGLHFIEGILSFFHRDKPGRIKVITSGAFAGIVGTEFVMEVHNSGSLEKTSLAVVDGKVNFGNDVATLLVTNGQAAEVEPGKAPVRTPGFIANNLLQWCFYYPGILDPNELAFTDTEKNDLAQSLASYRSGDLLAALAKYPGTNQAGSDSVRLYHAALLLAVGQIPETELELSTMTALDASARPYHLATSLRTLIAAVKREQKPAVSSPQLATEAIAASYLAQAFAGQGALESALNFARQAVKISPEFGFGWERVAELEFSFGHIDRAKEALGKALVLSPRNAQALALNGFLLAAENKTRDAIVAFDQAIMVDSGLGNAWLGRGLCKIRRGDLQNGREDLLIAAALEPQRASLRSYLAKAWSASREDRRAFAELDRAKNLDPNDPTAWLYSALLNEQEYRINEAVRDLEKSQQLNDNRGVYRSGLLLDQDRAVRSANLARIYDEAGMDDVALREASRATAADYGNFSAHLFLANSYQQLRDSSPFDLRYETPAFSEYLIASLLGPADGRLLAQPVTQQEYTHLFDHDTLGFSSSTEYLSRGAWNQYAAQYGTFKNSSYALESSYNFDPGQTPNGSLQTSQLSLKVKQMIGLNDGLFLQVQDTHQTEGDLSQRYDPSLADPGFSAHDKQEPSVLVGLDHKWSESQHTLFLASYFNDTLSLVDPNAQVPVIGHGTTAAPPFEFIPVSLAELLGNRLTVESFEIQHFATVGQFQTIGGLRVQAGSYHLSNNQFPSANIDPFTQPYFPNPTVTNQAFQAHSLRITPYLYEYWHATKELTLIGGLAYDYQSLPANALYAPLADNEKIQRKFSPKVGLIWEPIPRAVIRAAYSQSLGGANLDQSVRLEPTQLAGFTQAYRNIMPDSLVGSIGGAQFETADLSLEYRFETGTYVAVAAELLHSTADQITGGYSRALLTGDGPAVQLSQHLSFQEKSLDFSLHQLLGDFFSLGIEYRLADAHLSTAYPDVDSTLGNTSTQLGGLLHLINLDLTFNHPCGIFAGLQGQWYRQDLRDDLSGVAGDQFWQANAQVGYRSPRRHFEMSLGLLNITDRDYNLYPINLYPDLSRKRTFAARMLFNF